MNQVLFFALAVGLVVVIELAARPDHTWATSGARSGSPRPSIGWTMTSSSIMVACSCSSIVTECG